VGTGRILLLDEAKIDSGDGKIFTIFKEYYNRITDNLTIPSITSNPTVLLGPVLTAIPKNACHPSNLCIKSRVKTQTTFELTLVSYDTMLKEVSALDCGKKVSGSIHTKILKLAACKCAPVLTDCFTGSVIDSSELPFQLKIDNINRLHNKSVATDKVH